MRTLTCLTLALAGAAPALPARAQAPDEPTSTARALAALQRRAVWGERALRFQAALAEVAGADGRAEVAERLRAPRGAGVSWYPPVERLAAARRALAGPPADESAPPDPRREREQAELQARVDALDLVVVPGGFVPRPAEGPERGEPITVHVRALAPLDGPGTLEYELRLLWIGGGEPPRVERARGEPVTARALEAGFPVYLRPPASEPADWRLVPELARAGLSARSEGVPVPCLDWPARADDGEPGQPEQAGEELDAGLVRAGLELLRAHGVRWFEALGARAAARALDERPPEAGRALPVERLFDDPDGAPRLLWLRRPVGADTAREALVLLVNDHEPDDLPLAGVVGSRWAALADRRGALLFSAAAPGPGAGLGTAEVVERARAAARAAGLPDDAPLVAVGRGAAAARLALDPPGGLAGAVLCTEVRGDPEAVLPGTTRLLVGPPPGQAEPGLADGGRLARAGASGVLLVDDLELPGLVEPWLERLRR